MKTGANFTDQCNIKALHAEGIDAEEISNRLQICLPCVQSFVAEAEGTTASTDAGYDMSMSKDKLVEIALKAGIEDAASMTKAAIIEELDALKESE